MQKMDLIVLVGFGFLLIGGSLVELYVKDLVLKNLTLGVLYIVLVSAIVLTDLYSSFEASQHPHLKINFRHPDTGMYYPRDIYYEDPIPLSDHCDPNGEYPFGYFLPLVRPIRLFPPFGKVRKLLILLARPFNENFLREKNKEKVANWSGIPVSHPNTDSCEAFVDRMPWDDDLIPIPVCILKDTGIDALQFLKRFIHYEKLLQRVEKWETLLEKRELDTEAKDAENEPLIPGLGDPR